MKEQLPYYEILVNMYSQGEIDQGIFNQMLLRDKRLRNWYRIYQEVEKALKQCGDFEYMQILLIFIE